MSVQEQPNFQTLVNDLHLEPGAVTGFFGQPASGRTNLLYQIAFELCRRGHRVLFVATEGSDPSNRALRYLAEVRPIFFDQLRQDKRWIEAQDAAGLMGNFSTVHAIFAADVKQALMTAKDKPYTVMLVDNLNAIHSTPSPADDSIRVQCQMLRGMAQSHNLASIFTLFSHRPHEFGADSDLDPDGLFSEMEERERGIVYRGIRADDVWLVSRNEAEMRRWISTCPTKTRAMRFGSDLSIPMDAEAHSHGRARRKHHPLEV